MIRKPLLCIATLAALVGLGAEAQAQNCTVGPWGPYTEATIVGDHDQPCVSASGLTSARVVVDQAGAGGFRRATVTRTNRCGAPSETDVRIAVYYERFNHDLGRLVTGIWRTKKSSNCTSSQALVATEAGNPFWIWRARCSVDIGSFC